jgi:hypothetical protein
MADVSSFPARHTILVTDPQIADLRTFTAGEDITAGMIVELDTATGDNIVKPGDSDDAGPVVGSALFGASSGDPVTVCMPGCIVYVANEDDGSAVGESTLLQLADNNVGGLVLAYASGAGYIVGLALEDIAANGWGRAILMPYEQVVS